MRKTVHGFGVVLVAAMLLFACSANDREPSRVRAEPDAVRPLAAADPHGCDGLRRAVANCTDGASCATLKERLVANGCAPRCPCNDSLVATPFGRFCGVDGGVLHVCAGNFGSPQVPICAFQALGNTELIPVDEEVC